MPNAGETKRSIKERFAVSGHFYDIKIAMDPQKAPPSVRNKPLKTIGKHFGTSLHTIEDMKIQVLEYIKLDKDLPSTTSHRRKRELFWIHQLRTLEPAGLNTMDCTREALSCH